MYRTFLLYSKRVEFGLYWIVCVKRGYTACVPTMTALYYPKIVINRSGIQHAFATILIVQFFRTGKFQWESGKERAPRSLTDVHAMFSKRRTGQTRRLTKHYLKMSFFVDVVVVIITYYLL